MKNGDSRITGWVQPETFLLDADIRDRREALQAMAAAIGNTHGLDPAPIVRALERREKVGSTALGSGFAIPHARIQGIDKPLTMFMRTKEGIAFDAPDGQPVNHLLAIMVPVNGDKQEHLHLLALISRLFSSLQFRTQLDKAMDTAAAGKTFRAGLAHLSDEDE